MRPRPVANGGTHIHHAVKRAHNDRETTVLAFERVIGVDWSGAGDDSQNNRGLAVAEHVQGKSRILDWHVSRRSRAEMIQWLIARLNPSIPPTLIGLDFAFGFPAGARANVFGSRDWQSMTAAVKRLLSEHGSAKSVAEALNAQAKFNGHGPFRTNENRNDFRFYLDNDVRYYRLVENYVPEAISPWYMGSGATVGFSTITGLAALGHLVEARDEGRCDFRVFPFEPCDEGCHLLAEVYPAIWPKGQDASVTDHERDALRIANALSSAAHEHLALPAVARQEIDRVMEEGWIIGVR